MEWADIKKSLPENDADEIYLICHYNDHVEIAKFHGQTWHVVSNKLGEADEKLEKEYWPDKWIKIPKR